VRIALLAALAACTAGTVPASADPPPVGNAQYVVRNDPRLCPSPICGGYWVALANRSRTRCSDGTLRARCYVARAVDEARQPLSEGLLEGALVRGAVEPWEFQGFGELGMLVVADVRRPAGKGASGAYYRVRDPGVRCIRAPCFSYRAVRVNGTARITVSDVALQAPGATAAERGQALLELTSKSGLFVLGRVVPEADGGRSLRVARFYLTSAPPRA
jgi:hypothetical protein